jgi:hypothetical protein
MPGSIIGESSIRLGKWREYRCLIGKSPAVQQGSNWLRGLAFAEADIGYLWLSDAGANRLKSSDSLPSKSAGDSEA